MLIAPAGVETNVGRRDHPEPGPAVLIATLRGRSGSLFRCGGAVAAPACSCVPLHATSESGQADSMIRYASQSPHDELPSSALPPNLPLQAHQSYEAATNAALDLYAATPLTDGALAV